MSSSNGDADAPGAQLDPLSDAAPAEAQSTDWPQRVSRGRPRHAAITRNLQTLSSYQSWAVQVSASWESGAGETDAVPLSDAPEPETDGKP